MHCCLAEADELIMPDFGEAFDRNDAMLLTIPSATVNIEASGIRRVPSLALSALFKRAICLQLGRP